MISASKYFRCALCERCEKRFSLPEGTNRIPALPAVQTEPAVTQFGEFPPPDRFTGKHPGQDQVEDRDRVKHAAGGNAEDGNFGV